MEAIEMDIIDHLPSIASVLFIVIALLVAYFRRYSFTLAILISNFIVFFIYTLFPAVMNADLAFSPVYLHHSQYRIYTVVTTMFLHANLSHILGNMITLFFLGIPFERRVGWKKFLLIYFISGIGGSLVFSIVNPGPFILVGASGAIFGILGAFASAYPFDEIVMPLPVFFIAFLTRIKVLYAAIFFGLFEFLFVLLSYGYDNIAHLAHVGGLVTGVVLSFILLGNRSRKIRVFEFRDITELSTPQNREIIERVRFENIPEIRMEWMKKLTKESKCPYCGGKLREREEGLYCRRCGVIFR